MNAVLGGIKSGFPAARVRWRDYLCGPGLLFLTVPYNVAAVALLIHRIAADLHRPQRRAAQTSGSLASNFLPALEPTAHARGRQKLAQSTNRGSRPMNRWQSSKTARFRGCLDVKPSHCPTL